MTAVPATLRLRREGVLRSRAARGDAAAFAAVYERHHQALYRYCRSILRHEQDAQDALQSTMVRAFAALQDEQRDFELRPWLFRIAHNEAISILRRRRETEELDDVPVGADLEHQVSEREELRLLSLDLADLPERQRAALVLRELNGLSHAEIALVLEISAASVKQSIFEARSALFSCREGREMACHDVRRMLSDGDGRVLRGRGVRAHLRTCSGCRLFQADLEARPQRLRMLAPPLPTAGAAALLAQLLGGPAAKLLACVAIAGGGTTLAVEVQRAREAPQAAAAEATATPRPAAPAPPTVPAVVPASVTVPASAAPTATPPADTAKPKAPAAKQRKARKRAAAQRRQETQAAAPGSPTAATEVKAEKPPKAKPAKPEKLAKAKPAKPPKVETVTRVKPDKPPKAEPVKPAKPEQSVRPEKTAKPVVIAAPEAKREQRTPPGQAKKNQVEDEYGGDDVD